MIKETHQFLPSSDWHGELIPVTDYTEGTESDIAYRLAALSQETDDLLLVRGLGAATKALRQGGDAAVRYVTSQQRQQESDADRTQGSFLIVDANKRIQGEAILLTDVVPQQRRWITALRRTGKHFDHEVSDRTTYIRAWLSYEALSEGSLSPVYRELVNMSYKTDPNAVPWTIEPVQATSAIHDAIKHPMTTLTEKNTGRYAQSNAAAGLVLKSVLYTSQLLDESPETL